MMPSDNPTQSSRKIFLPLPPEPAGCWVYLLVNHAGLAIKLGITRVLPARVASLQGAHGDFDPHGSFVLRVGSRQIAWELESALKARFAASRWRATAPAHPFPRQPPNNAGGYTEWYDTRAFLPMLAALLDLHQRHLPPSAGRGVIQPAGMSMAEALGLIGPAGDDVPATVKPSHRSEHRDNAGWLAHSETQFASVRAWWDLHHHRLLSISDPESDHAVALWRTLHFAPATDLCGTEWKELFRRASVCLRVGSTEMCRTFLDYVETSDDGPVKVVFRLEKNFFADLPPDRFAPCTDLPRRICRWVANL